MGVGMEGELKVRYACKTCRRVVVPKNGRLRCCGFDEPIANARVPKLGRKRPPILDPLNGLWDDSEGANVWDPHTWGVDE